MKSMPKDGRRDLIKKGLEGWGGAFSRLLLPSKKGGGTIFMCSYFFGGGGGKFF